MFNNLEKAHNLSGFEDVTVKRTIFGIHVCRQTCSDVSEKRTASIFRVEEQAKKPANPARFLLIYLRGLLFDCEGRDTKFLRNVCNTSNRMHSWDTGSSCEVNKHRSCGETNSDLRRENSETDENKRSTLWAESGPNKSETKHRRFQASGHVEIAGSHVSELLLQLSFVYWNNNCSLPTGGGRACLPFTLQTDTQQTHHRRTDNSTPHVQVSPRVHAT